MHLEGPVTGKILGCLNLLWCQIGEEGLPMPWGCDRLPGKDETIGGELDLRVVKSGQAASDTLLKHHLGMLGMSTTRGPTVML